MNKNSEIFSKQKGGFEEELYKQKYKKYKNKYILLKKYNLFGGACSCNLIGYLPDKG